MAGIVVSSADLEEAVKMVRQKWRQKTNSVLTIRPRCMRCWRGDNDHPETMVTMGLACRLRKLTTSDYFGELSRDLDEAEKAAIYYMRGVVDEDVVNQMEKHIEKLERKTQELKGLLGRRPRRQREGVDASEWETSGDEASEEEEESVADPSCASSLRSIPVGEWDGFEKKQTPLETAMLHHMENVARSRKPLIGSGSEGAEVTTTASANPSAANPSAANPSAAPILDSDNTTPKEARKTTHKTIHLLSSREATPDIENRVKTVVKQFSHLSTLPPNNQGLAPSLLPRISMMFTSPPPARRAAPTSFAPSPTSFRAPLPPPPSSNPFHAPPPPSSNPFHAPPQPSSPPFHAPPPPSSSMPFQAPPPQGARRLRGDVDDGVINKVRSCRTARNFQDFSLQRKESESSTKWTDRSTGELLFPNAYN